MANFEAFRWNVLSSTNSEIGRSETRVLEKIKYPGETVILLGTISVLFCDKGKWVRARVQNHEITINSSSTCAWWWVKAILCDYVYVNCKRKGNIVLHKFHRNMTSLFLISVRIVHLHVLFLLQETQLPLLLFEFLVWKSGILEHHRRTYICRVV